MLTCLSDESRLISSSHEAMTDLIAVMGTLVDGQGHILIDGMYDEVAPLLPEEAQLYNCITFDTVRFLREDLTDYERMRL
jgi:hypothetical protein